jgi:hypothetical protein
VPGAATNRWIAAAAVAAAAVVLSAQLLVPPVSGLADNGDYQRVMGYAGFEHSTDVYAERYFSFLRTQYRVLPIGFVRSDYLSSETLLALAARFVSPAAWRGGLFDIRALAAVHIGLLLLALGLLVRACRDLAPAAQCVAAALLVFFFTDVGYAGPFNSFYSQTASLLFLLLTAAAAATAIRRGRLDGGLAAVYFLCAALFVASKPQEAVQAPILALLGLLLAGFRFRGGWRKPAVAMALALCLFGLWCGRRTPRTLQAAALYQVLFYETLPHSPSPQADMAELGLDPAWIRYSGTDAFQPDTPLEDAAFRDRFLASTGYARIVRFYLAHPGRMAERVRRASPKIWSLRPSYGNLERSEQFPTRTLTTRFAAWSRMRLKVFGSFPIAALALLLLGNAAFALATWRGASARGRLLREGILAAAFMSATAFGVCLLTNAPPDFSRVFYVAEALCDLLLVADAAWLVQSLAGARRAPAAAA